ncbi:unnamed protein product [Arabidopsis lyrata]|nr:unnamed protein product [Arabidopsis lyrata]
MSLFGSQILAYKLSSLKLGEKTGYHTLFGERGGLLSGGQRQTWAATEGGNLEGVLSLCGVHDAEAKLVFLCASNDNSLHLYDLPSKGQSFSRARDPIDPDRSQGHIFHR